MEFVIAVKRRVDPSEYHISMWYHHMRKSSINNNNKNNNNLPLDLTLGGPVQDVTLDVAEINRSGAAMGLTLNTFKCELIAHPDFSVTDDLLQSFARVDISDTTLLGAPLFTGSVLIDARI